MIPMPAASHGPATYDAHMPEERRLVTVLFADVVGSTAMGESLDPEDMRRILSRFYAIASEVVDSHGGTLEKFIGDAALVIFGIPQAHDDDPRRALAAALELRDRLRADPWLSERAPIRMGVNTGEVVAARERAGGDFIITGDPVNVAARLQQHADAWQILCTERTARAAGEAFTFDPSVTLDLKGKREGVVALAVTGRGEERRHRIPLVGRESDLAQLELSARRAFGERRPFLISLIAPAGTGKTRLLEEFLDRLPEIAPGARVAVAQCLPYGQRLTYWPMRALLLALVGLEDDAAPEDIRARTRDWLSAAGMANPERTADLLGATIGASDAEVNDRGQIFAAWRETLELAAAEQPLVLVVEDLHWSSDSLLDLVETILQPRHDAPVLMLALTRPELLDRRPTWGGGRRNHVSLALEPLEDDEVRRLVEHMLDGPAPEIVEIVVERADGNPFYAGEIVRSIVERATALNDAGAVADAVATLPDTVQATVLARLDLLEPAGRRVLQVGSVFGRSFREAGVAALDPSLATQVGVAVEGLLDRDLVRPAGPKEVAFRHILIREVAYQTLPRAERAQLHAAAGAWLESQSVGREDQLAELIAFHLREAATLLAIGGERNQALETNARIWLQRAAETALAGSANLEAARHLLSAIDLASASDAPELYRRLGDAYQAGNPSVEAYATALRLGREQGRPPDFLLGTLAEMLMTICRWYAAVAHQPSVEEIMRLHEEARALLPQVADERIRATYLVACAFMPFWMSNSGLQATPEQEATWEASLREGLAIAERLDDARLISAALDASVGTIQRTSPEEARQISRRRVAMSDRLDLVERLDALFMVAWMSAVLGDLEESIATADQGLAIAQPGQSPRFAVGQAAWQTYGLSRLGRWSEMVTAADRCMSLWIEADRMSAGFAVHGFIAAVDAARGRREDALAQRWVDASREIMDQFPDSHPTASIRALVDLDLEAIVDIVSQPERYRERLYFLELGLAICIDRGHPVPREATTALIELAASSGMRIVQAQALRAQGVRDADAAALGQALGLFEATSAVPYVARVQTEIGLVDGDEATWRTGIATLQSLGEVEQLERMRARAGEAGSRT